MCTVHILKTQLCENFMNEKYAILYILSKIFIELLFMLTQILCTTSTFRWNSKWETLWTSMIYANWIPRFRSLKWLNFRNNRNHCLCNVAIPVSTYISTHIYIKWIENVMSSNTDIKRTIYSVISCLVSIFHRSDTRRYGALNEIRHA